MLRPRTCNWFELIASREQLAPVLEALADTGAVELQTHEPRATPLVIGSDAERALERFHELARTYRARWPAAHAAGTKRITDPAATLASSVERIEAWRTAADPLIAEIERSGSQLGTLSDLGRLLTAEPGSLPQPALLASAGGFMIDARVYAVPARAPASELPADLLQLVVPVGGKGAGEHFVVLAGRRESMAQVDGHFAARNARRIVWPPDLRGSVPEAARQVAERKAELAQRTEQLERRLQALAQQHDLAGALADIEVVEWLIRHGSELSASDRLVWVTGWTTAADAATFCAPLHAKGLRCVVQLAEPPAGTEAPSLFANPRWVRAFETFARMVGQPGRDEADPSPMVALIAPLLFGFMFGDVGQGAVLCAAGWLLRKRVPVLVLLIPGGAMAMLFGLLFGTVFAREDLIPALWLHPLHDPITVLAAAIGLGAAILLGGLALGALQAHWRHAARRWWARDAGLVLAYVALLAAVFHPAAAWFALAGALWFGAGSSWTATGSRATALAAGLAHFVEQALQLVVNTVSFARVGAFALAHAGLSVAVTGVADASGAVGYWIVLVLGNLLILVLEGLVVGIQTTRLLLFEFFVRFLEGTGRAFRPLPPPLANAHPGPGSPP
ncbi:MAG: hypothetical protein EHM83_05060 [Burkholderiales bacterium]|nr:MAG: hypothetical protein EHM83_05060 [Burkholderiales bacterium]